MFVFVIKFMCVHVHELSVKAIRLHAVLESGFYYPSQFSFACVCCGREEKNKMQPRKKNFIIWKCVYNRKLAGGNGSKTVAPQIPIWTDTWRCGARVILWLIFIWVKRKSSKAIEPFPKLLAIVILLYTMLNAYSILKFGTC